MSNRVKRVEKTKIYVPTENELKLYAILADPSNYSLSVKERCEKAGMCYGTYYACMARPEFREILQKGMFDMIHTRLQEVIDATFKFAVTEKTCHADRKILLMMAGMYKDESNVNLKKDTDVCNATESELREALNALENLNATDIEPLDED